MKILAIRGKNLASLAGEFAIEFTQGPLASAGLFALSGPTGSGKSTILDALCLALFDATPRLKDVSTGVALKDVGEHSINQNHTANLLRRGCGEGYAEVDFVGTDQRSYRARWSLSRSRGKAQGKLQQVKMALFSLDSASQPLNSINSMAKPAELQAIGGTKTEVLREIHARLGLNFNQFTRAVLLAQNEFSAFLKAPDDERAALLEALTGTEIYSLISKMAFERTKAEKAKLEALESQLSHGKPMDAEARAEVEAQLTSFKAQEAELSHQLEALDATLLWFSTLNSLLAEQQQASDQARLANEAYLASQAERHEQTRRDLAESARPLLMEADRLSRAQVANSQAIAKQQQALAQAQSEQLRQQQACQTALQGLQQAQQALELKTPDILKARDLDSQLATLSPQLAQQQASLTQLSTALRSNQQQRDQLATEQQDLAQQLQATNLWLANQQSLEPLAQQWQRWQSLFNEAERLKQQQDQLKQDSLALGGQRTELSQAIAALQSELAAAEQTAQQRHHQVQQIMAQQTELASLDGNLDIGQLNAAKQGLDQQLQQLNACLNLWQQWHAKQQQQAKDLAEHQEQQAEQHRLSQLMAEAQIQLDALSQQLSEARSAHRLAELANTENVQTLRASLQQQSPCPVCGSQEHPYAESDPAVSSLLNKLKDKASEREHSHQQAQHHLQQLASDLRLTENQLRRLEQQIAESRLILAQYQQQWQALPAAEQWAKSAESQRESLIKQALQQLERERSQLQAKIDSALALQQALMQGQAELQHAQKQLDELKQRQQQAQQEVSTLERRLQHNAERVAEAEQAINRLVSELDAAFDSSAWLSAWQQDPASFVANCQADVAQWQRQTTINGQLQQQLQRIEPELRALDERMDEQSKALQAKQQEFAQLNGNYQALHQSRQALLDGQSAAEAEQQLKAAIRAQEQQHEQAKQSLTLANNAYNQCELTLKHYQESQSALTQEHDHAQAALKDWIQAQGEAIQITQPAELQVLLSWDAKQRDAERQRLLAIDNQRISTQTLLKERQARLAQHRNERSPEDQGIEGSEPEWQAKRQAAKAEHSSLRDAMAALTVELRQDDQRRSQALGLQAAIDQQAASTRLWAQLNELIGSESGKKFRNYAQQLTMDILLGYANMHLETLSRRYRLQRIPDNLALQVLDQDMGDEVRSVHSLSGGESFLVSLALALGLASLSSNRVQVETLFIDEGFGSLDGETLQVAMTALDCLQAQGRKVGVITHVQEMIERIEVQIRVKKNQQSASQLEVVG